MVTNLRATPRDPLNAGQDLVVLETTVAEPRVWMLDDGNQIAAPLDLDQKELEDESIGLLQGWQGEIGVENASTPLQNDLEQTEGEAEQLRVVLAAAGNYLFRRLREAMGEPMRSAFDGLISRHLQKADQDGRALVFMSDVIVPWRMLYADPTDLERSIDDDDDPTSVAVRGFLGFAGIVDHMMPITNATLTNRGSLVPVGVHTRFADLPGGRADLLAALRSRVDLRPKVETDERSFVKAILADEAALIYTFCHGRFRTATAGRPVQELLFRKKPLTGHYLQRRLPRTQPALKTAPIVFINACQGGVVDVDHSTTVINVLRESGASGTIGPVLDMPTCFGGVFGAELIRLLVAGESVSVALLKATRTFIAEKRNPLGLAYLSINGRSAALPMTALLKGGE
jgi:hypothetical protein